MFRLRRFLLSNSTSPSSSAASSPSSSTNPSPFTFPKNDINSIDINANNYNNPTILTTDITATNNNNKNKNKNKSHRHFFLSKSSSSSSILEESSRKKRDSWWNNSWNNNNNSGSGSNSNHRGTRHSMLPALRNGNGSNTSLATSSFQPPSPRSAGALRIDTDVHNNNYLSVYYSHTNSPLGHSNNNSPMNYNHNNKYLTVSSAPSPLSHHSNDSSLNFHNDDDDNGSNRNVSNHNKELSVQRQNEADEFIQKAIQFHEANELEKATYYFRLAADKDSPLGLFLYGIALRHGWGCKPNAKLAVRYLQKAAESAVSDINASMAANPSIARHELVLAIHELGVCFRHGWGVPKKKQTAAYYFEIAANLGDPDAQNDIAFCYYHGQGVKKDMKKAAKYYRMAAAQGAGAFGNSWIFKKKYDE